MRTNTWVYFLRDTVWNLFRNGWMTVASILTVAVALFVLASFMVLSTNLNQVTHVLESQVEMQVFVNPGTSQATEMATLKQIQSWPEVRKADFFTKQQAAQRLEAQFPGQSELATLISQANRLFDGYDVYAKNPAQIPALAKRAQALKITHNVVYQGQVVQRLTRIAAILRWAGWIVEVFLGLAALFIISNTIRLAVYARRREITIMKLVGATNWFIRWPFVLEGIVLGAVGAGAAVAGILLIYGWLVNLAGRSLPFWPMAPFSLVQSQVLGPLLVAGILVGMLGSLVSIRRFLRV